MKYFTNCQTIDEAKTLFRKLCKTLHPDKGGNAKDFINMFNQFKNFKPSKGNANEFDADKHYNIIQKFDKLNDCDISFVGTFIWVENTRIEQKETIKSIKIDGYNTARWAKNKKAWYFSPLDYKRKGRKNYSLDSIKNHFGTETINKRSLKLT